MNNPNHDADAITGNGVANDMTDPSDIRRDADGRYCLNDIQALFKRKPERDPSIYLGLTQTQELIMAMRKTQGANSVTPIATTDDREGLMFASEDLAIDYAGWISPVVKQAILSGFRGPSGRSAADALAQAMEDFRQNSERAGALKPH